MTSDWQFKYRRLVLLKATADRLVSEVARFSKDLAREMEAMGPYPAPVVPAKPDEAPAAESTPHIPAGVDYDAFCNWDGQGRLLGEEYFCDMWLGHNLQGYMHYSVRPRTFIPPKDAKPITPEQYENFPAIARCRPFINDRAGNVVLL
jgi:hypothetical protein